MNVIPVVHGSSIFCRGETQSLCTATVGNQMDIQRVNGPYGDINKRFMFHYAFPSFAINEIVKYKGVSRRETGHGALAERALSVVMPDAEIFPFPVRVVGETMASNGSSSMVMQSIKSSVPVMSVGGCLWRITCFTGCRRPHSIHCSRFNAHPLTLLRCILAAGVSIGLITDCRRSYHEQKVDASWKLNEAEFSQSVFLTDLQGIEDQYGDMDFKIAGTGREITALQLDVKLPGGIDAAIVKAALNQAGQALTDIFDRLKLAAASSNREERPAYGKMNIDPEALGTIIGDEGQTIRGIEHEAGARIVLNDDGVVDLYAPSERQLEQAKHRIDDLMGFSVHTGETYDAKVVKLFDYGAFVELPNGFQCLLHISQLVDERVTSIEEVLEVGQTVRVKCIGRDVDGNITLSSKGLLQSEED